MANEKKHEQAIVHLEKVSLLNPNDFGARFFLAQQLLQGEPYAKKQLKVAQSLYSTRSHCNMEYSWHRRWQNSDVAMKRSLQRKLIARAVEERNEELQEKTNERWNDLASFEMCHI